MIPRALLVLVSTLVLARPTTAALPQVDFDRMGQVGLAGSFAGIDVFDSSAPALDPTAGTVFTHFANGSLAILAATNGGGAVSATCTLGDIVYFGGSFSSLGGIAAANIASYTPSSSSFSALGSGGPNGAVFALYCDTANNKVWAGGKFADAVAVWDPKASSWSAPPFGGLSGAQAEVLAISSNSSGLSLLFAGSFITSFAGNGATTGNHTNNPNVPFSSGATPFSSSLVPVPLTGAEVEGQASSTDPSFGNIDSILCPSGPDGPGNTWFAAGANTAVITARAFRFLSASGIRLGNTFLEGRGTTQFQVTTIPDNAVQTLTYFDSTTNKNATCSDACPLGTNSAVPYQDFLFGGSMNITGIQVKLFAWQGAGPGLHLFQLLSSGAFASATNDQNGQSCFAPHPSNVTQTGVWTEKDANTGLPGTLTKALVADVQVGTNPAQGPSFTWKPYVSATGIYDVRMLVPGCTDLSDCALRTSVHVTIFTGPGTNPTVIDVNQQNSGDTTVPLYSGPISATTSDFVMTVSMVLANNPVGTGQNGQYELVADRIELVLREADIGNTTAVGGGSGTGASPSSGFGLFEWPLQGTTQVNATSLLPNSSSTAADAAAVALLTGIGGNFNSGNGASIINAVVQHSSGAIFVGGSFEVASSKASNIAMFANGVLQALPDSGLNGVVTSLVMNGDTLFVGGAFTSTVSGQTKSEGVISYSVSQAKWSPVGAGVDGGVTGLSFSGSQLQVVGNFTHLLASGSAGSTTSGGYAIWNTNNTWSSQSSLLIGSMTLAGNTTSPKGLTNAQFVAGKTSAFSRFGSTGFITLSNGESNGVPTITPLGVQLFPASNSSSASNRRRRRSTHVLRSWLPKLEFSGLFARAAEAPQAPAAERLPNVTTGAGPAVYAGTFWTNGSTDVTILGGNFSLAGGAAQNVAVYDPKTGALAPLAGAQVVGVVRALLVQGSMLYVGGAFSVQGASGFAAYDLAKQQWANPADTLKPGTDSIASVLSITTTQAKGNTIIVAGSFGGAGTLACNAICAFDTSSHQWTAFGSGIAGQVATVTYAGTNNDVLVAAGAIALSDNTQANVATYTFSNSSWAAVGSGLPGPVTALEVNAGNSSSIFAAGKSADSNVTFFSVWNGASWSNIGSTLDGASNVTSMTMVPLVSTHSVNGIIEKDRMLLVSGALTITSSGGKRATGSSASSALFDGQNFFPYLVSQSSGGGSGSVSALVHSLSKINFNQRHVLATGIVILISIAIAAGIVFLIVLIGILWALFSRRHEREEGKYEVSDMGDDDSTNGRPTSLLAHINAATRNTIMGAQSPFGAHAEKELAAAGAAGAETDDGYGPDADGFARAETPSDAIGMAMGGEEEGRPARARYSFDGTEDGELPLSAGTEVLILDDRDPAWWYAVDPRTGREGVVPSNYVIAS